MLFSPFRCRFKVYGMATRQVHIGGVVWAPTVLSSSGTEQEVMTYAESRPSNLCGCPGPRI